MNKLQFPILLLGFFWVITGCKKVERNDAFLHSIYSVLSETSNLYRTNGSFFTYQYPTPAYKTLVAGDTLIIAGILGGSNAQRSVSVGDSAVSVFNQASYRIYSTTMGDTVWTNIDYFQCRIPRGVTGSAVPVSITVNGITINAPAIKVQQYTDIPSATDTTLIVEKIAEWMPAQPGLYQTSTGLTKMWLEGTVTNAGNIWFRNELEGIVKIANGTAQQVLKPGAQLTPAKGVPFTIVAITGFAVDIDETVLYFSASTTEATADTAKFYITRLCKMDISNNSITVLNRSTVMRTAAQYPRAADLSTLLYHPADNYLPAEGNLPDVKLVLSNIHIATDGSLLARNMAYNTVSTPKNPLAGDPRFPQFSDPNFYAQRDSVNARVWYGGGTGKITAGTGNMIRIRNGIVQSLAKPNASIPVPARGVFYYSNQQVSTDGKWLYTVNSQDRVLKIVSTDDLESETIGKAGAGNFSFSSIDSSDATRLNIPTIPLDQDRFSNYYVLSNKDVVCFPSDYQGISMLGLNFSQHNAYVYAGTEKGLKVTKSDGVAGQDKTTGLAKWVNFAPTRRSNGANIFIGFDRKNALYFVNTASTGFFANEKCLPMEIYRIRKP